MTTFIHGYYKFSIIKKLGAGCFGEVYEVGLPRSNETYALKKYAPEPKYDGLLFNDGTRAEGERTYTLLDRFKQEMIWQAQCMSGYIVKVYAFSLESGFFVMEKADSDLSRLLREGGMGAAQKTTVILDVLHGLKYLHEDMGLLHRDIKPQNILSFKTEIGMRCKISDFGLIKNIKSPKPHDVVTGIAMAMGSGKYRAPEVVNAGLYSVQTDIYAVGIIMDEMGLHELDEVIRKCLATRPSDRYKSVSDLIVAIEKRA